MIGARPGPTLQLDSNDCGPACLRFIVHYYGGRASSAEVRNLCNIDESGMSLLDMKHSSHSMGMYSRAYEAEYFSDDLRSITPWIAEMSPKDDGSRHYVVVIEVSSIWVKIMDPAHGVVKVPKDEFVGQWRRIVVTFEAGDRVFRGQGSAAHIISWVLRKPRPYYLVAASLLAVVGSLVGLGLAFVMQRFVEELVSASLEEVFWPVLLSFLTLMTLQYLLGAGSGYVAERLVLSMIERSSKIVAGQLDRWHWRHFTQLKDGDVLNRFRDPDELERSMLSVVSSTVSGGVSFVLGIVLIGVLYPHLIIPIAVGLLVPISTFALLRPMLLAVSYRQKLIEVRIDSVIMDYSRSRESLKAFGVSGRVLEKYLHGVSRRNTLALRRTGILLALGVSAGISPILVMGWAIVSSRHMSEDVYGGIGGLVFQLAITGLVFGSLAGLLSSLSSTTSLRVNLERMLDVEDRARGVVSTCDAENFESEGASIVESIAFQNFSFPVGDASGEVSLDLRRRSSDSPLVVGLTGRNGVGKSSLMRAWSGVAENDGGEVFLNGNVANLGSFQREFVTYMPQDDHLISGTVLENISLGREQIDGVKIEEVARVLELPRPGMSRAELDAVPVVNGGENFSGGQARRIILARTLVMPSRVLLLDEPFDALDQATVSSSLKYMRELDVDFVVLSTHDKNVVDNCDIEVDLEEYINLKS